MEILVIATGGHHVTLHNCLNKERIFQELNPYLGCQVLGSRDTKTLEGKEGKNNNIYG